MLCVVRARMSRTVLFIRRTGVLFIEIGGIAAMTSIALQILEGHERGRTYSDLTLPITIGREEDNAIRLNDERASRFHAKIQVDDGRVILTDLESTNGTRVNGHIVQMRVLQSGDQILIGRSLIAFWPDDESGTTASEATVDDSVDAVLTDSSALTNFNADLVPQPKPVTPGPQDEAGELFPDGPPPMPTGLAPAQRAEMSDLLSFVHQGLVAVSVSSYSGDGDSPHGEHMIVPTAAWQQMVSLQRALAEYLAGASNPD